MWSTPGRALRVPVNAVLDFGVDLNLTEFLGAELPSNVVEGIAAILRPVLERMGSRPAQPKRGA